MRRVRLLPAAEADLALLADFLIKMNPHAAEKIGELLEEAVLSLSEFSERAPANAIFYRVRDQEVLVTRIFHTRENR